MKWSNHRSMRMPAQIAFVDLAAPNPALEEELLLGMRASLRSGSLTPVSMVENFERGFARHCGTEFCISLTSGIEALRIALVAGGVTPGDIVLTVPNWFSATAQAISQAGAYPGLIDVDDRTGSMDPHKLEEYLEARCCRNAPTGRLVDAETGHPVAGIVPVHLFGQTADMDPLLETAERHQLFVVEEASQAQGAEYFSTKRHRWVKAGSIGHAAVFSLDASSNWSAFGEAATITTNNADLAQGIRTLRDRHASAQPRNASRERSIGLPAIHAAILEADLGHLAARGKKRRENAFCYHGLLASLADDIAIPYEPSWAKATYHHYAIRLPRRDELRAFLRAANIETDIHCPVPLHQQEGYRDLFDRASRFPVAERIASETLLLPVYPDLEFDQQYRIAQKILEFFERKKTTGRRCSLG